MKLAWIDALRGLAILMVLANHVALVVPGLSAPLLAAARFGQMGVQLFFVVSAYTLCLSWQQRRGDETRPLLAFGLRRIFRIAPLYWFGIALFGLLDALQGSADPAHSAYSASNLLANALFVHGFLPAAQNSIVPGGWSIGAEMAFYALFPLLIGLLERRPGPALPLLLALGAAALNLLIHAATQSVVANNSFAYFHILNQLPVFLIGMTLYQAQAVAPASSGRLSAGLLFVGGLMLAAWLWRSGWALAFALLPVVVALSLVGLTVLVAALPGALWSGRLACALRALGRRSFAVYIIHVLFAWQGLHAWMAWRPLHGDLDYLLALASVGLCAYLSAGLLERFIERPGMALGRRLIAALGRPAVARA